MATFLLLASTPAFRAADSPPNPHRDRISTLDGLRGLLAYGVFFHHAAILDNYLRNGKWSLPPSHVYRMLGPSGVEFFFLITGYLFWTKMLDRQDRVDWRRFYIERVFRIGPLYLAAIAGMLLLVSYETRFELRESFGRLTAEIAQWSALGLSSAPGPPVNGYADTNLVLAGVTWTLSYEWIFYVSLPLLAFAIRAKLGLLFAVTSFVILLLSIRSSSHITPTALVCTTLFTAGMMAASLQRAQFLPSVPRVLSSVCVLISTGLAIALFPDTNNAGAVALLVFSFVLIVSGSDLFGLLRSRAAIRLGNVSYGIYLLQGLVYFSVFLLPQARAIAVSSATGHWALILACGVVLMIVATWAHVGIERIGIDAGRRLAAASAAKTSTPETAAVQA